ncbi:hypothetical protein OIV83_002436 [Microbotryomycetes sp. JL201]|nr:hypothetical protein OIV83_002436 [Microbotryomycetes sp. JL201]
MARRHVPKQVALLAFYGINHHTSSRIMARLQFHDQLRVGDMTEPQLNALSALLSSPAAAARPSTPLRPFLLPGAQSQASTSRAPQIDLEQRDPPPPERDPISSLVIEEDLRRRMRADIAHHRTVGTLKGRQHAMGLPVRGQRNKTNARTAKKLNRIERRYMSTAVVATADSRLSSSSSSRCSPVLEGLRALRLASGRPSLFASL